MPGDRLIDSGCGVRPSFLLSGSPQFVYSSDALFVSGSSAAVRAIRYPCSLEPFRALRAPHWPRRCRRLQTKPRSRDGGAPTGVTTTPSCPVIPMLSFRSPAHRKIPEKPFQEQELARSIQLIVRTQVGCKRKRFGVAVLKERRGAPFCCSQSAQT